VIRTSWDLATLAANYHAAKPFPHLVLDDLVAQETLRALCEAVAQEPHWPNVGEIYSFMGSNETVSHPMLRAFQAELGAPQMLDVVRGITGRQVTRCDLRSYVYLAGSYLLPHADSRVSVGRMIAYAYYIYTNGCEGGELELFDCRMVDEELVSARPAIRIKPKDNRMVIFDVTNASLHQVCEVLAGARVSLTGWFFG
jgi:hypothetical protein